MSKYQNELSNPAPNLQPLDSDIDESGCEMSAAEGLRLMKAFLKIGKRSARLELIEYAEELAAGSCASSQ